jgi:uncharacterized protein YciI
MHALVLMVPGTTPWDDELDQAHERFIDDLDRANKVVLGGAWKPPAERFVAAYVLSCESLEEARELAKSDPLARADAIRCEVVEWELVGVNPDAVDREALLYP